MPVSRKGKPIFERKGWLNDDPQTVDTLKDNLDIEGGGSGLPEIGSGDNGKVLTASVHGDAKEATWETPSGGGSYFVTVGNTPSISQDTVELDDGSYVVTENWFTSQFDVQGVGNLSVTIDGTTISYSAIAKNATVPFNTNYEIGIFAEFADEETWVIVVFPINEDPSESIVVSVAGGTKLMLDETFSQAVRMAIA